MACFFSVRAIVMVLVYMHGFHRSYSQVTTPAVMLTPDADQRELKQGLVTQPNIQHTPGDKEPSREDSSVTENVPEAEITGQEISSTSDAGQGEGAGEEQAAQNPPQERADPNSPTANQGGGQARLYPYGWLTTSALWVLQFGVSMGSQ